MFSKSNLPLLLAFFAILQLSTENAAAAAVADSTQQQVTTSVNTTRLFVGETFTMKCELPANYDYGNNKFRMRFYHSNDEIAYYDVSYQNTKTKMFTDYLDNDDKNIASVHQQGDNSNITVFEIGITTKAPFTEPFHCAAYRNEVEEKSINSITVTAAIPLPPPPPPTLTSNVTTVQLNSPFTLTCSLQATTFANVTRNAHNYSVAFYSSRDGQLARYDVNASGSAELSVGDFEHALVDAGARSAFPAFDLVVTEAAYLNQTVWCELAVSWASERRAKSNEWGYSTALDFTSISVGVDHHHHQGRCTVVNVAELTEKEYQVRFYTDLGPKAENLLGYFRVKPHHKAVFVYEHLPTQFWASVTHGAGADFPSFGIDAQVAANVSQSALTGKVWWCALHVGAPGTVPDSHQLIKSNVLTL